MEDNFILPKIWKFQFKTPEHLQVVGEYIESEMNNTIHYSTSSDLGDWVSSSHYGWGQKTGAIEITFEQFKKYVLKEPVKDTNITEYVKCINPDNSFTTHLNAKNYGCTNYQEGRTCTKGAIYKVIKYIEVNPNYFGYSVEYDGKHYLIAKCGVESSTKEAYDAQFKPKEKSEFKKGDYIITLEGDFDGTVCAKENYCFKIRENSNIMSPAQDLEGSTTNSNITLVFDKSDKLKDWRYATLEEIFEYDRLGEPYDVTTLKPIEKWSIGSYVVCTKKYTYKFDIGCIGQIEESDRDYVNITKSVEHPCLPFKSHCNWFATLQEAEIFSKTLVDPYKDLIGKWWKIENYNNFLCYIESETNRYGIGTDDKWFKSSSKLENNTMFEASTTEVKSALLSYAKENYPVDTKYKSAYRKSNYGHVRDTNYEYDGKNIFNNSAKGAGTIFYDGKWAEIIQQEKVCLVNFPHEGYCKTLDKRLYDYLKVKYPNWNIKDLPYGSKSIGVAWNANSYWYVVKESGKSEYTLQNLLPFINTAIEYGKNVHEKFFSVVKNNSEKMTQLSAKHSPYLLQIESNAVLAEVKENKSKYLCEIESSIEPSTVKIKNSNHLLNI